MTTRDQRGRPAPQAPGGFGFGFGPLVPLGRRALQAAEPGVNRMMDAITPERPTGLRARITEGAPPRTLHHPSGPGPARRTPGTEVTVRKYPAFGNTALGPDHAFVEIRDPRTGRTWIARGGFGLDSSGWPAHVTAEVRPSHLSRDAAMVRTGKKTAQTVAREIVNGATAEDLVELAESHAARVQAADNPYHAGRNSNSFASDVNELLTGRRLPKHDLPGAQTRLRTTPPAPRPPRRSVWAEHPRF